MILFHAKSSLFIEFGKTDETIPQNRLRVGASESIKGKFVEIQTTYTCVRLPAIGEVDSLSNTVKSPLTSLCVLKDECRGSLVVSAFLPVWLPPNASLILLHRRARDAGESEWTS